MKLVELAALIDRHGAMITDWPMAEWEAARALLATSEDARRMLTRARSIEVALGRPLTGEQAVTPERIEQVMTAALARAHTMPQAPVSATGLSWLPQVSLAADGWVRYGLSMALGAMLGILVGYTAPERAGGVLSQSRTGIAFVLESLYADRPFGS